MHTFVGWEAFRQMNPPTFGCTVVASRMSLVLKGWQLLELTLNSEHIICLPLCRLFFEWVLPRAIYSLIGMFMNQSRHKHSCCTLNRRICVRFINSSFFFSMECRVRSCAGWADGRGRNRSDSIWRKRWIDRLLMPSPRVRGHPDRSAQGHIPDWFQRMHTHTYTCISMHTEAHNCTLLRLGSTPGWYWEWIRWVVIRNRAHKWKSNARGKWCTKIPVVYPTPPLQQKRFLAIWTGLKIMSE